MPGSTSHAVIEFPIAVEDPVNARILRVSEDRLQGFRASPFRDIAEASGLGVETVLERVRAMLEAGVIRRVRQTVLATSLAPGALVAWQVPSEKLDAAFEFMAKEDPFSGHVVIRSADAATPGSQYKLWTTLKVPQAYSMAKHCELLCRLTGAEAFRLMPAKKMFALGVGHVRRREIEPGEKTDAPGRVIHTNLVELNDEQWTVLAALKREFEPEELVEQPWRKRADQANVSIERFIEVARQLEAKGVIGRFSTFLEHAKKVAGAERVTRFNALFHWRVPEGRELEAGLEVGRFLIMTHAYWREGGAEFRDVNLMGVAHGLDQQKLLAHKAAIDEHLESKGIAISYRNVFWGGRSEIKPSEIMPDAYRAWLAGFDIDPAAMRL